MKKIVVGLSALAAVWSFQVCAEEDETYMGPYDSEPAYQNNTGALLEGDTTAEIISPDSNSNEDVSGAVKGEITLHETDSGITVLSGLAKVEDIAEGSDGWVGQIKSNTPRMIRFQPAGRPELECPAQELTNWFGPCKVAENG